MRKQLILLSACLTALMVSCREWQPVFTPDYGEASASEPYALDANTVSIAELKAMYKGTPVTITDDIVIRGQIVSSDQYGQNYRMFYIEDISGGLEVKIGKSQNYNDYRLGQWVYIKCQDLTLGASYGMISLGYKSDDPSYETAYIDVQSLIDTHIFKGRIDPLPEPVEITAENMADGKNFGRRVRFRNLTYGNQVFTIVYDNGGGSTYLRNGGNFGITTWSMSAENVRRHILADRFQGKIPEAEVDAYLAGASAVNTSQYFTVPGASEPLQVRTSGYAKFADSEIPEGVLKGAKVDITGILMSSVKTIVDVVTYVLIAFVSISLVVSSIMIAVITLISVLERTKEIGILRAMGASKRNVSSIFSAETFIIGALSGLLGVGVTIASLPLINRIIHNVANNQDVNAVLPKKAAIALILISIVLTILAGFIPSKKAAKQDPVIALRSE